MAKTAISCNFVIKRHNSVSEAEFIWQQCRQQAGCSGSAALQQRRKPSDATGASLLITITDSCISSCSRMLKHMTPTGIDSGLRPITHLWTTPTTPAREPWRRAFAHTPARTCMYRPGLYPVVCITASCTKLDYDQEAAAANTLSSHGWRRTVKYIHYKEHTTFRYHKIVSTLIHASKTYFQMQSCITTDPRIRSRLLKLEVLVSVRAAAFNIYTNNLFCTNTAIQSPLRS